MKTCSRNFRIGLTRLFHKLQTERRLGVGFAASPRPKPVANRRSTPLPFHAACEISGLTLIEILFVVTALVFVAFILLPSMVRVSKRFPRITCVNNLKQVGLSFRIYSGDNHDRYPMNIGTTNNPVVNEATPVYQYFNLIANELGNSPKDVICPSDLKRKAAKDFTNFSNSNISYFIGLDSNENLPQTMVSGDRNITNGFAPKDGLLAITTNQMVGFTDEIHLKQGNIALGDGSVQQVSSTRLRSDIISNTGMATNRIKLP
jgi:type II secretory pathway pseudopilin PulG